MTDLKQNTTNEDDISDSLQLFETRWRFAVFPAMITFVLLIGFMFYLIYGMLQRMEDLSADIHDMSLVITEALPVMQGGIVGMSSRMQWVGEDMKKMSKNMNDMSNAITTTMPKLQEGVSSMSSNVADMTVATTSMAMTTHNMGQNIWDMNRNFSKPLSAMNKVLPWSNKNSPPRPMAPPFYPAPVYGYPTGQAVNPRVMTSVPPSNAVVSSKAVAKKTTPQENAGKSKYQGFCASCHGIHGEGGVGPSLVGRSTEYITQVLTEYRQGKRIGTMVGVVEVLSKEDIVNVAAFLGKGGLTKKP